jgi:aspartate aminotransferase-like enzyme
MQESYMLLAPGPVNLHPKVREILAQPMIHHRTPQFDAVLKRVLDRLRIIFQTSEPVYAITSTGSGGMEALMVNTCSVGDSVVIVNSGKFGERWIEMAKAYQLKVHEIKVPWGEAVDPKLSEDYLQQNPMTRAVFCQATETSTAVAHPIQEIANIVRKYENSLFLVDGITALGAYNIEIDNWGIDGCVAGSQKAFMLPTGMSFLSFSKKAWRFIPTANIPRYYFDIRGEDKANKKGETWFSSNVAIIKALDFVLDEILNNGLNRHFSEIDKRASFTRHFGERLGFKVYAKRPSNSVTALALPMDSAGQTIDGQKFRERLELEKQITIMGGQDQLKGKILRIGHMGYIEDREMIRLFLAIQDLALQMKFKPLCESTFNPLTQTEMTEWLKSYGSDTYTTIGSVTRSVK